MIMSVLAQFTSGILAGHKVPDISGFQYADVIYLISVCSLFLCLYCFSLPNHYIWPKHIVIKLHLRCKSGFLLCRWNSALLIADPSDQPTPSCAAFHFCQRMSMNMLWFYFVLPFGNSEASDRVPCKKTSIVPIISVQCPTRSFK